MHEIIIPKHYSPNYRKDGRLWPQAQTQEQHMSIYTP